MPEGPEVRCMADALRVRLHMRHIIGVYVDEKSKYSPERKQPNLPGEIPGMSKVKFPLLVHDVDCQGKHLFIKMLDQDKVPTILEVTFGLEGRFLVEKGKHSNITFAIGKSYKKTINTNDGSKVVETTEVVEQYLFYDDMRHFGNLTFHTETSYENKCKMIGLDWITADITYEYWNKIMKIPKYQDKEVCRILMDQTKFSGIGNYLKSEILYLSGIKPDRLLSSLSENEMRYLFENIIDTVRASYRCGGLTIRTYVDPNGRSGLFPICVYGKSHDANGNVVCRDVFSDKRTTYWVKEVQH